MAFSAAQLDADLAILLADCPASVTFSDQTHGGSWSALRREFILADEGLRNRYRRSLYIVLSEWTTPPATGSPITADGQSWRVLACEDDGPGRMRRLDIGESHAI